MNRISIGFVRTGIVVLAVCLTAGCTKPVHLTEADNSGQVTLKQGQELVIALEANPTTGYKWELADCDRSVLSQQGEPSYAASQPVRPGSSGLESWRFTAQAKGETGLRLVYHRPWEEDTEPAQTFTAKVVVR
jgi:inhibitor of cysteine peptidase